ncbi:MAG TPA: 50S ribosomal protein L11 methyltransferase [Gaiellaceae bacterium]
MRAEEARATMLDLFPEGFEELEVSDGVELVAYTDAGGEERLWAAFGGVTATDIEEGWQDRWRRFHRPVRVGALWVGPPWEQPAPDAIPVVIDPGRAFGTGAHATTRLCLELLQGEERGSVLDVGCGSGVLAIAAAKLGFGPVVAVDNESAAIQATLTNAAANGVAVAAYELDARHDPLPPADLVVANISLGAIEALAPHLTAPRVIASGYLASEAPQLPAWRKRAHREVDGWAADVLER